MNFLVNFWGEFVNFWGRGVNFGVNFFENLQKCVNFWDKFAEFGRFSSLRAKCGSTSVAIHYALLARFLGTNLHFKNARGAWWIASTATQSRNDEFLRI